MGDKGEHTRELIKHEAYKLFALKGFKEVTMKDICEATGLSRGGLYRHYSGTNEIFDEIISEEYVISDRIEHGESATKILEDMLQAIRKEIMEKELSLSLAIYEYASLGHEELFVKINNSAMRRWESLIEYGISTKEFKQVDAKQVTHMILYYYQGLRMWSRVVDFHEDTAEYYIQTIKDSLLSHLK